MIYIMLDTDNDGDTTPITCVYTSDNQDLGWADNELAVPIKNGLVEMYMATAWQGKQKAYEVDPQPSMLYYASPDSPDIEVTDEDIKSYSPQRHAALRMGYLPYSALLPQAIQWAVDKGILHIESYKEL